MLTLSYPPPTPPVPLCSPCSSTRSAPSTPLPLYRTHRLENQEAEPTKSPHISRYGREGRQDRIRELDESARKIDGEIKEDIRALLKILSNRDQVMSASRRAYQKLDRECKKSIGSTLKKLIIREKEAASARMAALAKLEASVDEIDIDGDAADFIAHHKLETRSPEGALILSSQALSILGDLAAENASARMDGITAQTQSGVSAGERGGFGGGERGGGGSGSAALHTPQPHPHRDSGGGGGGGAAKDLAAAFLDKASGLLGRTTSPPPGVNATPQHTAPAPLLLVPSSSSSSSSSASSSSASSSSSSSSSSSTTSSSSSSSSAMASAAAGAGSRAALHGHPSGTERGGNTTPPEKAPKKLTSFTGGDSSEVTHHLSRIFYAQEDSAAASRISGVFSPLELSRLHVEGANMGATLGPDVVAEGRDSLSSHLSSSSAVAATAATAATATTEAAAAAPSSSSSFRGENQNLAMTPGSAATAATAAAAGAGTGVAGFVGRFGRILNLGPDASSASILQHAHEAAVSAGADGLRGAPEESINVLAKIVKTQSGRHAFVTVLNQFRSRKVDVGLGFTALGAIVWETLTCCAANNDVHTAKIVMMLSQTFYRTIEGERPKSHSALFEDERPVRERPLFSPDDEDDNGGRDTAMRQYLKDRLVDHHIWHDGTFWEQVLWQCTIEQVRAKSKSGERGVGCGEGSFFFASSIPSRRLVALSATSGLTQSPKHTRTPTPHRTCSFKPSPMTEHGTIWTESCESRLSDAFTTWSSAK